MAIKDLPKYKDLRSTIRRNGRYQVVGTEVKDTIVIHHSMTAMFLKGSTPQAFANTHIDTNGWQGIAYPFVIMPDGTIYQCDDLDRRTNHAGNTNTRSIGICVVGDFRKEGAREVPTPEQKLSLYLLVKELQKTLPKLTRILGHQECPGYSWKNCPGDMWNYKDVVSGKDLGAVNGWKKENDVWYFYQNGAKKMGWLKDKGSWYYLDGNGAMKTGWVKDSGKWYYLNPNGDMRLGWFKENDKWYYLNPDGSMKTGWLKDKNKWYYLKADGSMATGVVEVDGKLYYLNSDGSMIDDGKINVTLSVDKSGALKP